MKVHQNPICTSCIQRNLKLDTYTTATKRVAKYQKFRMVKHAVVYIHIYSAYFRKLWNKKGKKGIY